MCIVLVEDEPAIRLIAAEVLEDAGHLVVQFETAVQAKAFCDAPNVIFTVLTDINMPGEEDGLDLAAHVVRTRPAVSVIVTSGRYAALPSGMPDGIGFLPKPWTVATLLEIVGDPHP